MSKVTYPNSNREMPKQKHFAVIKFGSVFIPGDERSRTHPGHGYPASYETTIEYIAFEDETSFKEWIKSNYDTTQFTAIYATPLIMERVTTINLKEM